MPRRITVDDVSDWYDDDTALEIADSYADGTITLTRDEALDLVLELTNHLQKDPS